jgi:hypothetical protein
MWRDSLKYDCSDFRVMQSLQKLNQSSFEWEKLFECLNFSPPKTNVCWLSNKLIFKSLKQMILLDFSFFISKYPRITIVDKIHKKIIHVLIQKKDKLIYYWISKRKKNGMLILKTSPALLLPLICSSCDVPIPISNFNRLFTWLNKKWMKH